MLDILFHTLADLHLQVRQLAEDDVLDILCIALGKLQPQVGQLEKDNSGHPLTRPRDLQRQDVSLRRSAGCTPLQCHSVPLLG